MADNSPPTILIRCQCGKKYRVKSRVEEAGFVCTACGQTIRVSASATPPAEPRHWSENILWTAWAAPVCILVAGLLLIASRELSTRPLSGPVAVTSSPPPASSLAVVTEAGAAQQDDVAADVDGQAGEVKVLFPGREFPSIEELGFELGKSRHIEHWKPRTDGGFFVDGDRLITRDSPMTATVLEPAATDFDLTLTGNFTDQGNMYFLLGWDAEARSGYVLVCLGLVNSWPWSIYELRHGTVHGSPAHLDENKLRIRKSGDLKLSIHDRQLSLSFDNHQWTTDLELPEYQGGAIVFGTFPNRYGSKNVGIDRIGLRRLD